ncbi:hypothetical protein DL98DRAFT_513281 [Cadophora sp. DSE1049]|nr:hypothetical protein DL98DRAFT_513281 [Cadophora sp. DSE1049]
MFTTTEESRHFLHQLQILTTHYKDTFYMSRAKSNAEVSVPALRHVTSLRTQHMAWSIAFESLLESRQQPEVSNMERTKRAILKMNNLSIAVLLPDVLSIGETGFDSSYLNFTRIVALAKEVLVDEELFLNHGMYGNATDQRSTKVPKIGIEHSSLLSPTTHGQVSQQEKYMPMGTPQSRLDSTAPTSMNYPNSPVHVRASFTTSLGIVYPLYVVATKCRNRELRREAIRLLLSSPRREGLWDSLLSGQVAQWVMEIEEEGLAAWDSSRAENAALDLRWIAEDKRVVVREVLFDLQHRTAKCRCGTSGVGEGEPDERARETTLKW